MLTFKVVVVKKENRKVMHLNPPIYFYYADPFIVKADENRVVIVYEVYDRFLRKGRIDLAIFDFEANSIKTQKLINERFHLSYPCPIFHGGNVYISPESSQIGKQIIYKLNYFDGIFKAEKVFEFDQRMVDATFFPSNNEGVFDAYFYTGSSNCDGLLVSTSLSCADDNFSFSNSYKIVGEVRPAGAMIGKTQPFQKPMQKYGHGVCFYEIDAKLKSFARLDGVDCDLLAFNKNLSHHINEYNGYICFDLVGGGGK